MIITNGTVRLHKEFYNFTRKELFMLGRVVVNAILFFMFSVGSLWASAIDSVGSEVINGKVYVLHQVSEGETVYSISVQYKVQMRDIVAVSPEVKKGLFIGMIIRVPYVGKQEVPVAKTTQGSHKVKVGETLFSISRMYKVTVEQLMMWNNLESSTLSIGQELLVTGKVIVSAAPKEEPSPKPEKEVNTKGNLIHIVTQGEGLYGVARIYNVTVDDITKWNQLQSTSLSIGQELIVGLNAKAHYVHPIRIDTAQESIGRRYEVEKVIETGVATIIEGTSTTNKYLALHRTAKVGAIIAVRNEMNDQMVFVRVIGKLPNTGVNTKVVIRISDSAYKKLGAIDEKFRVQLSYLPN